MKKILHYLVFLSLFVAACSKSSDPIAQDTNASNNGNTGGTGNTGGNGTGTGTSTPTLALTNITNNTVGDPGLGAPEFTATYAGKLLTKVVWYEYIPFVSKYPYAQTHIFNYNSAGQLISTDINDVYPQDYTKPQIQDIIHTEITYTGTNISDIKLYRSGNSLAGDYSFTYQNGQVYQILYNGALVETYKYDNTGNYTVMSSSAASTVSLTYDNKKSISSTIPFWQYFYTTDVFGTSDANSQSLILVAGILHVVPSTNNNLLTILSSGQTSDTHTYNYNGDGYPITETVTYNGIVQNYSFQYATIN